MSENSNKNRIKFKEKLDKIKFTVDNSEKISYIKNIIIVIITIIIYHQGGSMTKITRYSKQRALIYQTLKKR